MEALRALNFATLGIPTMLDPIDVRHIAPWLGSAPDDDERNSIFGSVNMDAWNQAYVNFADNCEKATSFVEAAQ